MWLLNKLIHKRINYFLIGLMIVASCNSGNKCLKVDEYGNYCLLNSEFRFGEICYQDSISKIIKILGEPLETNKNIDLNLETWRYKSLQIDFHNDLVWSVKALTKKYSTPSGFRIGMSKSEIIRTLGSDLNEEEFNISENKLEVQIVNCEIGNYMIFIFDSNDILIGLEFDNDIP